MRVYPKVFCTGKRQKIYYHGGESAALVEIRIYGMERYSCPRTDGMRIDEEWRHAPVPMTREGEGIFSYEFDFPVEQRYTFRILEDGKPCAYGSLYSVCEDLFSLGFFKGDTHMHSCRSDGKDTPFEVACAYRREGFDFICLTDHHRYAPSLEARDAVAALTDIFTVFAGEEVHNKDMGYVHIVNFGGGHSVNDIIENDKPYLDRRLREIAESTEFPGDVDPKTTAMRLFIAEEIRRSGGLAVLAHPFWNTGGEYSMETPEMIYHLRKGSFDALELLASDDRDGNGDNLQVALYYHLRDEGIRTPILGASDRHDPTSPYTYFNRHFSLVFAKAPTDIPSAIAAGMSVAVNRRAEHDFFVFGEYRLVKYTRFLLDEFYPLYTPLAAAHAEAMAAANGAPTAAVREAEQEIQSLFARFFA